ncbi:hypothetical protein ACE41H_03615 [Paenibacillus enshidis]|uniref:Uncharacterized protein n=1 Tax=Paenibacillus enshidis TaxID=1458439 RepID=A0ABV5ANV2_9BACL
MAQKVKASGSFSGGKKTTKTTAITWTVPAKSVYTLRAGSVTIKTNGYMEVANSAGVVVKRTYNSGHWTTADFSDSIFVKKL